VLYKDSNKVTDVMRMGREAPNFTRSKSQGLGLGSPTNVRGAYRLFLLNTTLAVQLPQSDKHDMKGTKNLQNGEIDVMNGRRETSGLTGREDLRLNLKTWSS
jgi:hypothetical protein